MSKPTSPARAMSEGQLAYESRRAARAGMSLDKWLDAKAREAEAAARAAQPASAKPAPRKGLISRLIDRAHKPL